jgi:hypothetical protein
MPYNCTWHIPDKVLRVTIEGEYSLADAEAVNQRMLYELERSQTILSLLVDAQNMERPYNFREIRNVQTYMNHRRLQNIYIVANDQLVKLAMMVIFNLSRASFYLYDDIAKADLIVQRHLNRT